MLETISQFWGQYGGLLLEGTRDTLIMVFISTLFAYVIGLMINQFGGLFTGSMNIIGLIFAVAALVLLIYMLVRPYKEATKLSAKI